MFRKSVFGVLAVAAAAAAAVVAVRYVQNRKNSGGDQGTDEGDEVRFIEINDEEDAGEDSGDDSDGPGQKPEQAHVDSVTLDDADSEEDALNVQKFAGTDQEETEDGDVKEIAALYPYLSASFIAGTLKRNDEFNSNFPEDTLVSVMHTCGFPDMRSVLNFEVIMADAGYICQHDDSLRVRAAKRFFSEEGAVISDILNVANQAAALGGSYIDCELN